MSKKFSFALAAMLALSPVAGSTAFAQTQVQISPAAIQTLLRNCAGAGCATALQSLISSVRTANPTLSVSAVAAAIAAEVAAAYNGGTVSRAVAREVFSSVASTEGVSQTVTTAMNTATNAVNAGQNIDSGAIADAGSAT